MDWVTELRQTLTETERLQLMQACNTKQCPFFFKCIDKFAPARRYEGAVFISSIAAVSSRLALLTHFKPWQHAARHIFHAQLLAMSNSPSLPSPPSSTAPPRTVAALALFVWG